MREKTTMKLSTYQENALNAVEFTSDNLILGAVAGSGKSTMLEIIAKRLREIDPDSKILYLAFNNEICKDIEPRLSSSNVNVLTFHKYGKQAINAVARPKISDWKYNNLVKETLEENELDFEPLNVYQIVKVINIIRLWWVAPTAENIAKALDHNRIVVDESWLDANLESLAGWVKYWIGEGFKNTKQIDFVDMLTFTCKFYQKMPLEFFHYVLVDECQDLSTVMRQMILQVKAKGSRVISVGDRYQAINAFAGADPDSFDKLKEITNAVELPLSVCYRCPDPVIELASKYVATIEGTGKEGELKASVTLEQILNDAQPQDLMICRRNAPLLKVAFRLLRNGHSIKVKGRDFAEYLTSYIAKVEKAMKKDKADYGEFLDYLDEMIFSLMNKARSESTKELLSDVHDCLTDLYTESESDSVESLRAVVKRIFDETNSSNAIYLSSFHRSKGLQAKRVFILQDKPLPSPPDFPDSATNHDQERNLAYVAITRATKELYLVDLG